MTEGDEFCASFLSPLQPVEELIVERTRFDGVY